MKSENLKNLEKFLLRPGEAFDATGVGRSMGYQLIASGEWPSIRIGKAIRIPTEGLRTWIEKKLSEQGLH